MAQEELLELKITGMSCDSCQDHGHALENVPGVRRAEVHG